jgi:hypothetical protein
MGSAPGGKLVKLGFPAGLSWLPFGRKELFVLEAMKRGVERSLLDLQSLAGHLLNPLCDGITMNGAKRDDPHDEEIECTLREIESIFGFHTYAFYI